MTARSCVVVGFLVSAGCAATPPSPPPRAPDVAAPRAAEPTLPEAAAPAAAPPVSTRVDQGQSTSGGGDPLAADGKAGATHLLVMYAGSKRASPTITRSREEAARLAAECLAKARAPGARFVDVVEECSDEPGAVRRGGSLGRFQPGAMVAAFEEALFRLRVGEISDVVETPFGFHVILRTH